MRARSLLVVALPMFLVVALAGCAGGPFGASTTAPSATPSPTPSAPPTIAPGVEDIPVAAPQLHPGGTAEQNELYWAAKLEEYRQAHGIGSGVILSEQLAADGFDLSVVEISSDLTAIGLATDSFQVAVRFGDECLVGSVRADRTSSAIVPVLATGRCLIGGTVPVG